MLEQITIQNFQCHRNLVLKLSPTVNCLTGRSDVGKSAVLRALRWACLNKPQGEAFLREGQEHASVSLKVDGHEVLRERGPGLNGYSLDGHRYQAFGSEVPPEIAALLNLSELNFQGQHSPSFWLTLSPGQVSRELNAVVDLEIIDQALAHASSSIRHARAEMEVSEKRLAQAREERDQLAWTKEAGQELNKIIGVQDELAATRLKCSRIESLVRDGERAVLEADRLACVVLDAANGIRRGEEALRKAREAESLGELLGEINQVEQEQCHLERSLGDVRQELSGLMEGMKQCPLCGTEIPGQ